MPARSATISDFRAEVSDSGSGRLALQRFQLAAQLGDRRIGVAAVGAAWGRGSAGGAVGLAAVGGGGAHALVEIVEPGAELALGGVEGGGVDDRRGWRRDGGGGAGWATAGPRHKVRASCGQ